MNILIFIQIAIASWVITIAMFSYLSYVFDKRTHFLEKEYILKNKTLDDSYKKKVQEMESVKRAEIKKAQDDFIEKIEMMDYNEEKRGFLTDITTDVNLVEFPLLIRNYNYLINEPLISEPLTSVFKNKRFKLDVKRFSGFESALANTRLSPDFIRLQAAKKLSEFLATNEFLMGKYDAPSDTIVFYIKVYRSV